MELGNKISIVSEVCYSAAKEQSNLTTCALSDLRGNGTKKVLPE
jgi:hypothetical protein